MSDSKSLADLGGEDNSKKPKARGIQGKVSKTTQKVLKSEIPVLFDSQKMLDKDEQTFYNRRMSEYMSEYNLNKSADIGMIHRIIMEEIITERLYRKMLEEPAKDFSDQISESADRYRKSLDALGASRDKRIKNRETNSVSIAEFARDYIETGGLEQYRTERAIKEGEESALLSRMYTRIDADLSQAILPEEEKEDSGGGALA